MISIVIASVNEHQLSAVKKNIEETIGVEFEIIDFANDKAREGLCQIYNRAAKKAKYNVICFMHEDLQIRTANWGKIVLDLFDSNVQLGLLGLAGSKYKSAAPSTWFGYGGPYPQVLQYNFIQHYKFSEKKAELRVSNPDQVKLARVACVDGFWLCSTKAALASYQFDETLLKGFHGYDLDFSIGIGRNYEVAVTFDILIEHFSEGNTDKNWLKEILKVHEKWSSHLPLNYANLTPLQVYALEKKGFKSFIHIMRDYGYNFIKICQMLNVGAASKAVGAKLLLKMYFYLLKTIVRSR
jgi:hypothetical protein